MASPVPNNHSSQDVETPSGMCPCHQKHHFRTPHSLFPHSASFQSPMRRGAFINFWGTNGNEQVERSHPEVSPATPEPEPVLQCDEPKPEVDPPAADEVVDDMEPDDTFVDVNTPIPAQPSCSGTGAHCTNTFSDRCTPSCIHFVPTTSCVHSSFAPAHNTRAHTQHLPCSTCPCLLLLRPCP